MTFFICNLQLQLWPPYGNLIIIFQLPIICFVSGKRHFGLLLLFFFWKSIPKHIKVFVPRKSQLMEYHPRRDLTKSRGIRCNQGSFRWSIFVFFLCVFFDTGLNDKPVSRFLQRVNKEWERVQCRGYVKIYL